MPLPHCLAAWHVPLAAWPGLTCAGTPELGQGPGANDGLTDFSLSLDEFERPPELPGGQQQQRQQQAEAMGAEGLEEDEEEDLLQDDGVEEAQQQGQGGFDDYASPALPSAGREFGTGVQLRGIVFELCCAASSCGAKATARADFSAYLPTRCLPACLCLQATPWVSCRQAVPCPSQAAPSWRAPL